MRVQKRGKYHPVGAQRVGGKPGTSMSLQGPTEGSEVNRNGERQGDKNYPWVSALSPPGELPSFQ